MPAATHGRKATKSAAEQLPNELICMILESVDPNAQEVFAATSKVCRQWYRASQRYLYKNPKITGKNYRSFAATIAPSSTNIKPSPMSGFIERLDLSMIVHEAKPSLNARLVRRVHNSVREFIAPQSSFGYTCIVALGHCLKLRMLDLTLIAQSISLDELFRHLAKLPELIILNLPRTAVVQENASTDLNWPKTLESVSLGGSILDVISQTTVLPPRICDLSISHCPFAQQSSILNLICRLSHNLTSLSVNYPIRCLAADSLDSILQLCPKLQYLLVAVDYISAELFAEHNSDPNHPLQQLDLDSSGNSGTDIKVCPNDIFNALAEDRLTSLRTVRVSKRLGWIERRMEDVEDLVDMLEAKAAEADTSEGVPVGVWEFDSERLRRRHYESKRP